MGFFRSHFSVASWVQLTQYHHDIQPTCTWGTTQSALELQLYLKISEEKHEQAVQETNSCCFLLSDPDIVSTANMSGTDVAADFNFCWEVQHSWEVEVPSLAGLQWA